MGLAAVLAVLALCLAVQPAWANKVLDSAITVSDDITRIHVNKLDAQTHEFVPGAVMQIIEKDTGSVVDEWTTDGTTHQNEKGLNVNVVYVLHEEQAPDGYAAVEDIEFMVNEMEGTGITILSDESDEWELTESYKVAVYDRSTAIIEQEQIEHRSSSSSAGSSSSSSSGKGSDSSGSNLGVKTGDTAPVTTIALVAVAALAIVLLAVFARRRNHPGKHAK